MCLRKGLRVLKEFFTSQSLVYFLILISTSSDYTAKQNLTLKIYRGANKYYTTKHWKYISDQRWIF